MRYLLLIILVAWQVDCHATEFKAAVNNQPPDFDHRCGLNPKAATLAKLIINHQKQQRQQLTCHPILAETAAQKAQIMATNQRVEHNLDFKAPNALLESNGYLLPAAFLPTSNQVESIAGGKKTAEQTLHDFLNSQYHRPHMLGTTAFHASQIHIGVGYHYNPNTKHEHYWVVHIAQPNPKVKHAVDYTAVIENYTNKNKQFD